ncbi:MAG: phenylalanine--tRNA ligase subunit beta [Fimbriimonadaceae bacterium]
MKLPISMINDLISVEVSESELMDALTMLGLEVEGGEKVGSDFVLDIKVVSNRGDCLSALGIARELRAKFPEATASELFSQLEQPFDLPSADSDDLKVVRDTPDCDIYFGAIFEAKPGVPTPPWVIERLEAAGMRSLGVVVDLTNYVMLETGQPLHAFDLDKLRGNNVVVRGASSGEEIELLNGEKKELFEGQLMICDAERPVAAAGVMGGADTEFSEGTKRILLESAHFDPSAVRKSRRFMNLSTEASYRFERGVDRRLATIALNRFFELYGAATGHTIKYVVVGDGEAIPEPVSIEVRVSRATELLGFEVTAEEAIQTLKNLGCGVTPRGETLVVRPPSWRNDLVQQDDLVEEVGRVLGYDRIPATLPKGEITLSGLPESVRVRRKLIDALISVGGNQCMTHTLTHPSAWDAPGVTPLKVRQSETAETISLKTSLISMLAEVARINLPDRALFFEVGRVSGSKGDSTGEKWVCGALDTRSHNHPRNSPLWNAGGYFGVKAVLEQAADHLGIELEYRAPEMPDSRFHGTRQADVIFKGTRLGVVGELHPTLLKNSDLPTGTGAFEIDLKPLLDVGDTARTFRHVHSQPAVWFDLSATFPREVAYGTIRPVALEAGGPNLESMTLIDVYEGPNLPDGLKSITLRFQLRSADSTFTQQEANQVRDQIVAVLEPLGARIRA